MSLTHKILGLIVAVFAAFLAIAFGVQQTFVYSRFVALEQDEAGKNVERALAAIEREVALMLPSATDWATWDDTYAFVQDRNETYITKNLNATALKGLAVDLLAIYDRSGALVWGMAYDADRGQEMQMPTVLLPNLSSAHFLMRALSEGAGVAGIQRSIHGPLLVAARPVLTSEGEGPPMGMFLIARLLNADAATRLAAQAQVDLRLSAIEGEPTGTKVSTGHLVHTAPDLIEQERIIEGNTLLMDVDGAPAVAVSVATPREISAHGRDAVHVSALMLLLVGAVVLLVLTIGLRRIILGPLAVLTRHAVELGRSQDLSLLMGSSRRDELGTLARAFDHMVELLGQARQRLEEQSYRSGIAEMASGVLHNIGNAVTPLGVKLGNLRSTLRDAPVEEIDLAVAELATPASAADAARRSALQEFVGLAAKECGALVRRSTDELDAIQAHVEHVQMILADQHRFSRAEAVVEPVALAKVVEDAVRLMSPQLGGAAEVKIDPALKAVSPVVGARVKLQQTVSNLLINAAEAVMARGGGSAGTIHVEAWEEVVNDTPMVHLRVTDDGVGILPEHLPRLFERGFSTKQRGSGMGLHWTANTVLAMRGRIFAESDGPGAGARMHLVLPRAAGGMNLVEEAA